MTETETGRGDASRFFQMNTRQKLIIIKHNLQWIERIKDKQDYCSICKRFTDKKQVERNETCLEVCSVCDKEYDLPF